jgi:hypothetical protein
MVRYSQCCQPVPGDKVIGYITRGRGVSIHRTTAPTCSTSPTTRSGASRSSGRPRPASASSCASSGGHRPPRPGRRHRQHHHRRNTNIKSVNIQAEEMGMRGEFVVEVENLDHLKRVMNAVRRVKGVLSVERREHFGDPNGIWMDGWSNGRLPRKTAVHVTMSIPHSKLGQGASSRRRPADSPFRRSPQGAGRGARAGDRTRRCWAPPARARR